MRDKAFHTAGKLNNWAVVIFAMERQCGNQQLSPFLKMFVKISRELGIETSDRPAFIKYHRRDDSMERIFEDAVGQKINLILGILPGKTPYYGEIFS